MNKPRFHVLCATGAALVAFAVTAALSSSASTATTAPQPKPRVLSGYGSRVVSGRIPRKSPVVVTGHYTGGDPSW
jgi:hypothetical protein